MPDVFAQSMHHHTVRKYRLEHHGPSGLGRDKLITLLARLAGRERLR
jgi:hypothetical protein